MIKVILMAIAIMLTSCAATGPKFTQIAPPENEGILYLYRLSQVTHSLGAPEITINTTKQGKLLNGSYMAIPLSPGKYTIKTDRNFLTWDMRCNELKVEINSGHKVYVRLASGVLDNNVVMLNNMPVQTGAYQCAIFQVPEAAALPEIALTQKAN